MNTVNPVRNRGARWCLVAALAFLVISTSACSGGSGGGSSGGDSSGAPPPPPPPPDGLITITATDVFETPVPGAEITIHFTDSRDNAAFRTLFADDDGRAEVAIDLASSVVYWVAASGADSYGFSDVPVQSDEDHLDFVVTLHPSAAETAGVGSLSVTGRSGDGRQLVFGARLYVIESNASASRDLQDWNLGAVSVLPCDPDVGNDAMIFQADCVEGAAGFDASYQGPALATSWVDANLGSDPLAISLLLDQGEASLPPTRRTGGCSPPSTSRRSSTQFDRVVDRRTVPSDSAAGAGRVALLQNQPVTIFPVDNPGFTSDGRTYFPTIDALGALEGGASPLLPALGQLVQFTASSAPADSRRAVVVLADDDLDNCGAPAECRAAREALIEESASTDVPIVAVGLSVPYGNRSTRKNLGAFAQAEQGIVFWAQEARQVPTIFGRLPEILDGGHAAVDVTIQLQSSVSGAFASGNVVYGTLQVEICPWDYCDHSVEVPFALRIP